MQGDICNIKEFDFLENADVIISNPPYIKQDELANLQSEVKNETNASVEEQVTEEVKTEQTEDDNVTDINSKLEDKKVVDKIKDLQSKVEASEDKYKRLQAEYSNYIRTKFYNEINRDRKFSRETTKQFSRIK